MWSVVVRLQRSRNLQNVAAASIAAATAFSMLAFRPEEHPFKSTKDKNHKKHSVPIHSRSASSSSSSGSVMTHCDDGALVFPFRPRMQRQATTQKLVQSSEQVRLQDQYTVEWETPLGEGAYGAVYKAIDKRSGNKVAVKQIHKKYTDNHTFQREMDALLVVRDQGGHPNICGLRENFDQGEYFYIVLDLIEGLEMFEQLCSAGPYSEADAAWHIQEAASALSFLHGIGIVHCDLKPENLMLSSKNPADAVMKLVDLGCAHMKQPQQQDQQQSKNDQNKERRMSTASTPAYCPPEVLRDMRQNRRPSIDPSFDAWSLGVILYTMLVGLHPFDINSQASNEEIEQAVLSGEKPPLRGFKYARHLSEDAISLIENLMHHDPHRRLTAEQLLENRWVRGETASSQKIAGSDKRLALYRKYKTKIGSTFFKMLLNQTDAIHQQHHQHYGTNSDKSKTTERLSVLESAFRRLDTKKNGYLTTKDMLTGNNNHEQEPQDDEPSSSKSGFFAFLTDQQQDSDKDSDTQLSFSDLSSLLAESMKNRYFPNEHVVYNAGDKGDSMYLINSGTVQVTSPDGITMTRQSGEVFGEEVMMQKEGKNDASSGSGSSSSSTSANITYRTSVKCITPVHVLEIPRHLYTKYVSSDEETFLSMAETDRHRRREHANAIVRLNTEAKTKHLQRNDTIFCAGQRGNALYLVADGTVDIFVQDGHKVRTLQPGEMTGEHAAYFYKPYNVTAQCVSDSCQVQAIPASVLHKLFESNPAFRSNFRDLMVRRDFKKAVCAAIGRTFPTTEEEIRSAFDVIDLDKSGEVDLEALRTLVQKFDSNYDEKYIQEMLESLDLNKSGTLTWAEFYRIFAMDKES